VVDINFGRQSNKGRDELVSGVANVNCYVDDQGPDGKGPQPVYCVPGLTRWDSGAWPGASRVLQKLNDSTFYALLGTQLVKYTADAGSVQIGSISGTKNAFAATNQAASPEIGIVTNDNQFILLDSSTDTAAASLATTPEPPTSITFLDGYFVLSGTSKIFHTDLNDGNTIDPLAFATAESSSDELLRVIAHRGFVYAFGADSIEIWRNAGTAPFAFAAEQADINIGCLSAHSIVEVTGGVRFDVGLVFVDNNGSVRIINGTSHRIISNGAVDRAIQSLTREQQQEIHAIHYWFHGHEMVALKSAAFTWEFDLTTGVWHERRSPGLDRWQAQNGIFFNGLYLVGSEADGRIFQINPEDYQENRENYTMEAVSPPIHSFPNTGVASYLQLDMVTGAGQTSSNEDTANPKVVVSVSHNGGKTYGHEYVREIGRVGETKQTVRINRLGHISPRGISIKVASSSAVLRGIIRADLGVEKYHGL